MALSPDNVKTIRLLADKFEKWAENLSYDTSAATNLWSELTLSLYPQDTEGIAAWLGNIPRVGQTLRQEIDELSKLVQEIDAWRNQGVYPEDLGEFCARIHELMKVSQDIISVLRTLSEPERPEPRFEPGVPSPRSTLQRTEHKMSNSFARAASEMGTQPHGQENLPILQSADKALPSEALMAYKLRYEERLNMQQIAKRMTAELKLDRAIRPWQISRWIKQVERRRKLTQIPIRSIEPKKTGITERAAKNDASAQTGREKT
jgi:hypothetical protein